MVNWSDWHHVWSPAPAVVQALCHAFTALAIFQHRFMVHSSFPISSTSKLFQFMILLLTNARETAVSAIRISLLPLLSSTFNFRNCLGVLLSQPVFISRTPRCSQRWPYRTGASKYCIWVLSSKYPEISSGGCGPFFRHQPLQMIFSEFSFKPLNFSDFIFWWIGSAFFWSMSHLMAFGPHISALQMYSNYWKAKIIRSTAYLQVAS